MTEHNEDVHVYPIDGKEHVLDGVLCWCHPVRDEEEPTVVIHNDDDNCV